jgi:hypothetical protein
MAKDWTREKIKLPVTINAKDRKKIGMVIIEHIINRTAAGLDKKNREFPNYSQLYADKKGVGVSDVDLILTGEMLDSLEIVSSKDGEIVIGYGDPSDELAGKVEGNRRGSYGGDPDRKKARDFLGIDPDELDLLVSSYQADENLSGEAGFNVEDVLNELLTGEFK